MSQTGNTSPRFIGQGARLHRCHRLVEAGHLSSMDFIQLAPDRAVAALTHVFGDSLGMEPAARLAQLAGEDFGSFENRGRDGDDEPHPLTASLRYDRGHPSPRS